jgi:hypothetical protein
MDTQNSICHAPQHWVFSVFYHEKNHLLMLFQVLQVHLQDPITFFISMAAVTKHSAAQREIA